MAVAERKVHNFIQAFHRVEEINCGWNGTFLFQIKPNSIRVKVSRANRKEKNCNKLIPKGTKKKHLAPL